MWRKLSHTMCHSLRRWESNSDNLHDLGNFILFSSCSFMWGSYFLFGHLNCSISLERLDGEPFEVKVKALRRLAFSNILGSEQFTKCTYVFTCKMQSSIVINFISSQMIISYDSHFFFYYDAQMIHSGYARYFLRY